MHRSKYVLALAALTVTVSSCVTEPEPRPFAGRPGRSLDHPPRYGDTNRYMDPGMAGRPDRRQIDPDMDPRYVPPGYDTAPRSTVDSDIDPGLETAPEGATAAAGAGAAATTPSADASAAAATPPAPTTPPASTEAPYAKAVPGKPGFVYSPHEQGKILDVTGLRPGTKVKDPQTGAMFRVP